MRSKASDGWTFLTPVGFAGRKETLEILEVRSPRSDQSLQRGVQWILQGVVLLAVRCSRQLRSVCNVVDWNDLRASAHLSHSWPLPDTVFFSSFVAFRRREFVSSPPAAAESRGGGQDELLCPRTSRAVIFLADRC